MTFFERATESAGSFARDTVSTVSEISTAVAEGVVVTAEGIKDRVRTGRVATGTVLSAAALGLVVVVEWPFVVAAGGVVIVAGKLKSASQQGSRRTSSSAMSEDRPDRDEA